MMSTQEMLTAIQSSPDVEATAPSVDGQLPLRAWAFFREGEVCKVQFATEEVAGETTTFVPLQAVPEREDWELVGP